MLDGIVPYLDTEYGIVMEHLATGAPTGVNENQVFPSASLYKLGVAGTLMRPVGSQAMSLDATLSACGNAGGQQQRATWGTCSG